MKYPGEVIKMGTTRAADLRLIKERLNSLGYGPLDANNPQFGENTDAAIRRFQDEHQLLSDGIVGRLTWDRLFSGRTELQPSSPILRLRAVENALTQTFVREKTGRNDGKEVEEYLRLVGLERGYAWCAAFVYAMFQKASLQLTVINPVPKSGGVLDQLKRTKGTIIYHDPEPGDQFIMDFGGGKGHTGLVTTIYEDNKTEIATVEGNTNDGGSRDGDGVYERSRLIKTIKCFIRYE
jgi:peptidoglycan hydrolase-like protein with peptidoglycan-binding domain